MPEYADASFTSEENTNIKVDIDGITSFVPCVAGNRDYNNIRALVEKGELVIAPYTKP